MDTNIGPIDQLIRIALLVIAAIVYITGTVSGFWGTVIGFFGIYCFMTALTKYSPVWELFKISTIKRAHKI